jgi:hypothetical protein
VGEKKYPVKMVKLIDVMYVTRKESMNVEGHRFGVKNEKIERGIWASKTGLIHCK